MDSLTRRYMKYVKPTKPGDRAMRPGFGVERVAVTTPIKCPKKFRDHRVARIFRGRAELPPQNRMRMARSLRGLTRAAAAEATHSVGYFVNTSINIYAKNLNFS